MTEIVIFEDDIDDLILRYMGLVKPHDVHVFLLEGKDSDFSFESDQEYLEECGFQKSQIYQGPPREEIIPADVYFLDGLNRRCFEILEKLPPEKAFLVTGNYLIKEEAKQKNFQVVTEREIFDIVQRFS